MPRRRFWLAVQLVFFAIALLYFVSQVGHYWADIRNLPATLHPEWWRVASSGAWVLASYAVYIATWRLTVVAWGSNVGWAAAIQIWFISNLGKYIPGKVWSIGAMSALARESGVSSVAAVGSSLVVNLINLLAAGLVVMLAGSRRLAGSGFATTLVLFVTAVAAAPWLLPRLARIARRVSGREIPEPQIPPLVMVMALAGCCFAWTLYGIAFRELAVALLGAPAGPPSAYTAVFTLSYLAGYVAVFAPGGLGVREDLLATLLPRAGLADGAGAVTLVVVSLLWLTVLEATPGLILFLHRQWRASRDAVQAGRSGARQGP